MNRMVQQERWVIGVISDTHGPLTAAAKAALKGVDRILLAGDLMDDTVVATLEEIAPVVAVRGNMDGYGAPKSLAITEITEIAGLLILVLHDLTRLDLDPRSASIAIVIHGHTHRADIAWQNEVLFLNPGSAAEPRGSGNASVARITVENGTISPEIISL